MFCCESIQQALIATCLVSLLPNLLLLFIPESVIKGDGKIDKSGKKPIKWSNVMLCFAVGGLLGDVFLHSLPHMLGGHDHGSHDHGSHNHNHFHEHGMADFTGKGSGFHQESTSWKFIMDSSKPSSAGKKASKHHNHKKRRNDDVNNAKLETANRKLASTEAHKHDKKHVHESHDHDHEHKLVPEKDQHHDHDHDHGDDRDHDNEQKKENEIDSTEEKEHIIDVKSSENKEVHHDDRDQKHHHDHHSNDGADKHDDDSDSDSDSDDEGDEHHHHKVSKQTKQHDHHSHSGHGPSCPHHKHDHKHVHNAHKRDHRHTHSTVQHTDDHHHDGHDHGRRLSEGQNTCSSQDDPRCAKDKKTLYEMLGIEKSLFIQLTILFGFLTFFIAEKLGNRYFKHSHHHGHGHGHDENCIQDETKDEKDTTVSNKSANNDQAVAVPDNSSDSIFTLMQPSGYLNLLADSMHNLTDGIAIGAAFASGKGLAVATFISVILHEVPHEIGDFSILVQSGLSKSQAIKAQFVTALAAFIGTIAGFQLERSEIFESMLLAFSSGGFIYIATVSALASVVSDESSDLEIILQVLMLMLGVFMMVLVLYYEGDSHSHQ